MNDLLRVEAKVRSQELIEEGKWLATLERNMQIHRTHTLNRGGRKSGLRETESFALAETTLGSKSIEVRI
jgi:hypothetical protein